MPSKPRFPLRIYYDGACGVCAAEVEHYARRDRAGRLVPVDISAPDFDPEPLGLTLAELMYQLHAIDRDGTIYRNIDAFWAIWQAFPATSRYGMLAFVIAFPLVAPLARSGYRGFARIRRYLPKRRPRICQIGQQGQP